MSTRKYWFDAILWLLASPILFVRFIMRAYRHIRFLWIAVLPNIKCPCGATISLVGFWRCTCGYSYTGHVLRFCPVCATLPRMVRCYTCGATTKLPESQ